MPKSPEEREQEYVTLVRELLRLTHIPHSRTCPHVGQWCGACSSGPKCYCERVPDASIHLAG